MSMDYDSMAAEYARHRRVHPGVLSALLEGDLVGAASSVLEVGCGTGNYVIALQEQSGCSGWGVDPSEQMLKQACARNRRIRFSLGQAEQLAFPDATFDLVFSVDVIHHVAGREDFFGEAFRVLKSGGRLCTVTDSEDIIRRREPLANFFPETVEPELARYPKIADLRAMMTRTGFLQADEARVEFTSTVTDIATYRDKAFSSLYLISQADFERDLRRLEEAMNAGPVQWVSRYLLLWGVKA
jgi:ubiquinone/menaquinone biosynthesis C-methylase UbiE